MATRRSTNNQPYYSRNSRLGDNLMRPITRRQDTTSVDPGYRENLTADPTKPSSVVPTTTAATNLPPGYVGAASGGSPVGASRGGGGAGDLTSPLTGFASPFTPGAAPGIFDNPGIALMQAMKNMGYGDFGQNQGLYQMMLPQMNYANALATLALGQGSDLGAGANNAALNYIGDYATNLMTPGGQAIDFNKGLAALGTGANPNSVIGQFMNVDDPFQQVKNYQALALPLAASSLHPFFARAFQNAIQQAGDQYTYAMSGPNLQAGNFSSFFPSTSPFAGQ